MPMQKITPFLWFDHQAEEAAKFYTSIFKNSKIGRIFRYTEQAADKTGRPVGSVLTIEFEIDGQHLAATKLETDGLPLTDIEFVVFDIEATSERSQLPRIIELGAYRVRAELVPFSPNCVNSREESIRPSSGTKAFRPLSRRWHDGCRCR